MSVRDNYLRIMDNIRSAAIAAGRGENDVQLIAVTKFVEEARIAEAVQAGAGAVGENRVQELERKLPFFRQNELSVHLIGQLQTNKVKYIIGEVELIQSMDRLSLAREIQRQAEAKGVVQSALIEVNIGDEPQKGGVPVAELPEFLAEISALPNLFVRGLMCIPPAVGADEARGYFADMRRLFEGLRGCSIPNVSMEQLSMGMSGDYTAAIAEGATMVRVGTALFGARDAAAASGKA